MTKVKTEVRSHKRQSYTNDEKVAALLDLLSFKFTRRKAKTRTGKLIPMNTLFYWFVHTAGGDARKSAAHLTPAIASVWSYATSKSKSTRERPLTEEEQQVVDNVTNKLLSEGYVVGRQYKEARVKAYTRERDVADPATKTAEHAADEPAPKVFFLNERHESRDGIPPLPVFEPKSTDHAGDDRDSAATIAVLQAKVEMLTEQNAWLRSLIERLRT